MCTSHIYSPLEDHCVSLVFCSSVLKCNYIICFIVHVVLFLFTQIKAEFVAYSLFRTGPQYFYLRYIYCCFSFHNEALKIKELQKNYNTLLILCCGFYTKHISFPFCLRCCTYNNNWVFAFHLCSQLLELIPLLSSHLLVCEYDLRFPQQ